MNALRAALAFLVMSLAGCAAAPVDELPPAAEPVAAAPHWLDWRQGGCQSMTWSVPILASSLRAYLPEGFEPAQETPVAVGEAATIGFRAVECSAGFGKEDLLRSVASGFLFTPVLPPVELRDDRFAGRYLFAWDALVASDPWRLAAASWDLPLRDGGALVGPTAQGWTGAVAMDRVGTFTLTGRTAEASRPAPEREERLVTLGSQGFALWDSLVQNRTVATGAGLWGANPESWVATALGSTQGVATFELATWDMPHGMVHWPGQAFSPVEQEQARLTLPEVPA